MTWCSVVSNVKGQCHANQLFKCIIVVIPHYKPVFSNQCAVRDGVPYCAAVSCHEEQQMQAFVLTVCKTSLWQENCLFLLQGWSTKELQSEIPVCGPSHLYERNSWFLIRSGLKNKFNFRLPSLLNNSRLSNKITK